MTTITINPKLKADTFELGQLNEQTLLLMNNSLVPWFIILPNTQETELFKLDKAERAKLDKNIDLLSGLLVNHFKTDKLNIATIGNIVSQMHVHIIGRSVDDAF
ncbi:MAG: HIT domain-containing protein, partial [Xanthomonadales bacterium]|nr:HIT domain-containing protein [Xanthomonadales bacterium]